MTRPTREEVAAWRSTIDGYLALVDHKDSPLDAALTDLIPTVAGLLSYTVESEEWDKIKPHMPEWARRWPRHGPRLWSDEDQSWADPGTLAVSEVHGDPFLVPWEMLYESSDELAARIRAAVEDARRKYAERAAMQLASSYQAQREQIRRAVAADPVFAAEVLARLEVEPKA